MKTRILNSIAVLVLFSMVGLAGLRAETVVRGPYLQQGSHNGIHILWRTDTQSPSEILYGTSPTNLASTVTIPDLASDHEVVLTGLEPNTQYYYAIIGDSGVSIAGGDATHFFRTSPAPGASRSTRIWVIGDFGTANSDAAAVRDAFKAFNAGRNTDLLLMLGDNAYENGTDAQYQNAVFNMYPEV
ncbi:MAG: fibronectin type III domain-containing protein, partial [Pseudomonadota bacterium]